jgi:hypothetical protein
VKDEDAPAQWLDFTPVTLTAYSSHCLPPSIGCVILLLTTSVGALTSEATFSYSMDMGCLEDCSGEVHMAMMTENQVLFSWKLN